MDLKFILNSGGGNLGRLLCVGLLAAIASPTTVSSVRIFTEPDGAQFTVDGQVYTGQAMFLWPAGSKHVLNSVPMQTGSRLNTQYSLIHWETNLGIPASVSPVTADPSITYIKAVFELQYAVMLRYFSCGGNTTGCPQNSPGKVWIDSICYNQDADPYLPAGSTVSLQVYPNPGYVFTGWSLTGAGHGNGFLTSFELTQPVTVTPMFQIARPLSIRIDTSPPGLQLLVDRAPAYPPVGVEWGWNTDHAVGTLPVQRDAQGRLWIFDSWSDGGALNHTYTMAAGSMPVALTARFLPGATVTVGSDPPGLALNVDGRSDWSGYNFAWAAGTSHTVSAPAELLDKQGRKYRFQSWSNGGTPAQQLTVATPPSDIRLTAVYQGVAQIRLNSVPAGLKLIADDVSCVTPCTLERAVDSPVRVRAATSVPTGDSSRLDFIGWSDGGAPERVLSATLTPQSLTANYRLMTLLNLAVDPPDGGSLTVQPPSLDGYYDAQGRVTLTVQARPGFRFLHWEGDLAGVALSGSLDMRVPRAVRALLEAIPAIAHGGLQNGAGATPLEAVAPGSVVAIFGTHLAPWIETGPFSPLTQTLAGVTVRMGDRLLPLFFVSPGQINLQLPSDLEPGPQALTVQQEGKPAVNVDFTVARNAPGLFASARAGLTLSIAAHLDGTPVTPEDPAHPGESITLYGTGFGLYDRRPPDGFNLPATPIYTLVDPVEVVVNGSSTPVDWAGGASGRIAVQAVRFTLASDVAGGNLSIQARIGGTVSNEVLLPVD